MYRSKRRTEMPPHVFAVSDGAYSDMLNSKHLLHFYSCVFYRIYAYCISIILMDVPKKYAMHLPQQLYLITVGTILKIETDFLFYSRSWESIHAYHVSFHQKICYAKGNMVKTSCSTVIRLRFWFEYT